MMEGERMDADFAGVLKGALALSEEDKRRLAELMVRVTAPEAARTAIAPAPEPRADDAPEIGAAEWLRKIRTEPAWVQLQLIEDALESTDEASELQVLRDAQKALLQENPPLAIRRAVERVASEHPVGICIGGLGLLLALIALLRGLFHLVF
jgi:hypothetical protein